MDMIMDGGKYFNSCNVKSILRLENLQEEDEERTQNDTVTVDVTRDPETSDNEGANGVPGEIVEPVCDGDRERWKRNGDAIDGFPKQAFPQAPVAPHHQLPPPPPHHHAARILSSINAHRTGHTFRQWFHLHHHKEFHGSSSSRDERARVENAHVHSAVSIAGLAAGLATLAVTQSIASDPRLSFALASSTELLASLCVELAELAGADHDRKALVIGSAVDVRSPGDLMTLTATAVTALRAESALKERGGREARNTTAISPYDRGTTEAHHRTTTLCSHVEDTTPPCEGELLLHTQQGGYQWKHVSVYMSKSSQVKLKLKNKHVGGTFSKSTKCVVFGVCDEISSWPYRKERDATEGIYFGLRTGKGIF